MLPVLRSQVIHKCSRLPVFTTKPHSQPALVVFLLVTSSTIFLNTLCLSHCSKKTLYFTSNNSFTPFVCVGLTTFPGLLILSMILHRSSVFPLLSPLAAFAPSIAAPWHTAA